MDGTLAYAEGETPQRTLVLIKPDNFRFATGRPGNVIDFLSRTGLYIVGIKVHRMSVAEATEFYGPVREVLRTKLNESSPRGPRRRWRRNSASKYPRRRKNSSARFWGRTFGDNQFDNIVKFMSGRSPAECDAGQLNNPARKSASP